MVLYYPKSLDITETLLAELNRGHESEIPKPGDRAKPDGKSAAPDATAKPDKPAATEATAKPDKPAATEAQPAAGDEKGAKGGK